MSKYIDEHINRMLYHLSEARRCNLLIKQERDKLLRENRKNKKITEQNYKNYLTLKDAARRVYYQVQDCKIDHPDEKFGKVLVFSYKKV